MLFILAVIIFAGDFTGLALVDAISLTGLSIISVIPLILVGLAFLSQKEPLLSMAIAAIIIVGIWIYMIIATGGRAALTRWFIKATVIYFLIAGSRHAWEVIRIRKELNA